VTATTPGQAAYEAMHLSASGRYDGEYDYTPWGQLDEADVGVTRTDLEIAAEAGAEAYAAPHPAPGAWAGSGFTGAADDGTAQVLDVTADVVTAALEGKRVLLQLAPGAPQAALDRVRQLAVSWASLASGDSEVTAHIGRALLDVIHGAPGDAAERLRLVTSMAEGWRTPGASLFSPADGQRVLSAITGDPQPAPELAESETIECEACGLHRPPTSAEHDLAEALVARDEARRQLRETAASNIALRELLGTLRRACEQPSSVVGRTSGTQIVNGDYLAVHLLGIIGRSGTVTT
jgi:hypothetical protein